VDLLSVPDDSGFGYVDQVMNIFTVVKSKIKFFSIFAV
jgi:hypothetical protein